VKDVGIEGKTKVTNEKCIQNFIGNPSWKGPLWWIIKIDRGEMECDRLNWIILFGIVFSGGLMSTVG
jgi:hypothetical protein